LYGDYVWVVGVGIAWLGDVVIFFAEWARGTARGEPGIETSCVERMAAGEATYFVVVFECVDTDCACVTCFTVGQWYGSMDVVVLVVGLVMIAVVIVRRVVQWDVLKIFVLFLDGFRYMATSRGVRFFLFRDRC